MACLRIMTQTPGEVNEFEVIPISHDFRSIV